MKGAKIIKDFILSMLIVICVIIILCLIFYDDISLNKFIPESQEYSLTEEISKEMEENDFEGMKEVVTKYYIDASDLKKYEKTNEYNKGKKNPFAVEETPTANNIIDSNNNTSSGIKNNSTSFYDDDIK